MASPACSSERQDAHGHAAGASGFSAAVSDAISRQASDAPDLTGGAAAIYGHTGTFSAFT